MATRAKNTSKTEQALENMLTDVDRPDPEEQEFEEFVHEIGPSSSYIDIFKIKVGGSRPHLDRVTYEEVKADPYGFVRDKYGAGKFMLQFRGANRKYCGSKLLEVETVAGLPVAVQPIGVGMGGDAGYTAFMREQAAQNQQLITTLIASMKGPDIGSLLSGIAALMGGGNKQGSDLAALAPLLRPTDPAAMLTAVVAAFSAIQGPSKDQDWLTRMKDVVGLVKDLQPDTNGNGGREENMWSVVRDVGKEVVTRLAPVLLNGAPGQQEVTRPLAAVSTATASASRPTATPTGD
jgi:hypothetical protein